NGSVTMQPGPMSQGLLLLEEVDQQAEKPFSWDNATVYFVMTDRFYNGNPDNDNSYGRNKDGKYEIGTFHGGDLAGLTKKLDYIESLGVNA
ncbi:alpha-amylase, partial [Escherichia coli]|nr:alpha-amylase [Escherichia coli]